MSHALREFLSKTNAWLTIGYPVIQCLHASSKEK
jgi:hypothetical protein